MEEKIGGLIIAAGGGKKEEPFRPLKKLGAITSIKRIVLTFQQVGISPIVVITGEQAEEVEWHLAEYGVVFLRNENYEKTEMFDSARIGFEYLKEKCDCVVFTKLDVPLFTTETLKRIIQKEGLAVSPVYQGKTGHPISLDKTLIPKILEYDGRDGMRGFLHSIQSGRVWLNVTDSGIIKSADELEAEYELVERHNKQMLHPYIRLSIEKERPFFDARAKLLLQLIEDTHSVKGACNRMALSYSKAWNLLNEMEQQLGFQVVKRKHGGKSGGRTELSQEGKEFLERYIEFEQNLRLFAEKEFQRLFPLSI